MLRHFAAIFAVLLSAAPAVAATDIAAGCDDTHLLGQLDLGNQVDAWKKIAEFWNQDPSTAIAPPAIGIARSFAFGMPTAAVARRVDPIYIEVSNVVPGSTLELVNVSQDPDAASARPRSRCPCTARTSAAGRRASGSPPTR